MTRINFYIKHANTSRVFLTVVREVMPHQGLIYADLQIPSLVFLSRMGKHHFITLRAHPCHLPTELLKEGRRQGEGGKEEGWKEGRKEVGR